MLVLLSPEADVSESDLLTLIKSRPPLSRDPRYCLDLETDPFGFEPSADSLVYENRGLVASPMIVTYQTESHHHWILFEKAAIRLSMIKGGIFTIEAIETNAMHIPQQIKDQDMPLSLEYGTGDQDSLPIDNDVVFVEGLCMDSRLDRTMRNPKGESLAHRLWLARCPPELDSVLICSEKMTDARETRYSHTAAHDLYVFAGRAEF